MNSNAVKTNPMENELVLDRIFGFCDVTTLKNCRLVSPKWRDISLKTWRGKAVIQLGPNQNLDFGEFLDMIEAEEDDIYFQLRKHPFKCYALEFEDHMHEGDEYLLQRIGALMPRYVKINWSPCTRFGKFHEFLSTFNTASLETLHVSWQTLLGGIPSLVKPLKCCSNLKRLKLFTNYLDSDHSPGQSLWRYLLETFPKVEALSIGYNLESERRYEDADYGICKDDRLDIARFLKDMRQPGNENVLPLKELEMMEVFNKQREDEADESSIIKALTVCRFPLERLSIHVGWGRPNEIAILPLLKSCKDSLQYLKTSINFNRDFFSNEYKEDKLTGWKKSDLKPAPREYVSMEALMEMHFLNGLEWALYLLAHLKTPKLEKLVVEYDKNRNPFLEEDRRGLVSVSVPTAMVYEQLETFELHDNPTIPDRKTIRNFVRLMPNLTKLTLALDKSTFPLICKQFPGLKMLNILEAQSDYEELDDEALTGVTKAHLEEGEIPSRRRPNITDLEHLTDLRISCQRQLRRNDVKLTEHSVVYGFLQLPRLFNLSVAIKEICDEMKERLLSHVWGNVHFQRKFDSTGDSFAVQGTTKEDTSDDGEGVSADLE